MMINKMITTIACFTKPEIKAEKHLIDLSKWYQEDRSIFTKFEINHIVVWTPDENQDLKEEGLTRISLYGKVYVRDLSCEACIEIDSPIEPLIKIVFDNPTPKASKILEIEKQFFELYEIHEDQESFSKWLTHCSKVDTEVYDIIESPCLPEIRELKKTFLKRGYELYWLDESGLRMQKEFTEVHFIVEKNRFRLVVHDDGMGLQETDDAIEIGKDIVLKYGYSQGLNKVDQFGELHESDDEYYKYF